MKCEIKYIGETEAGLPIYFCFNHKAYACDEQGNKLEECLCQDKELFDNELNIKDNKIDSIRLEYTNILKNKKPIVYVNDEKFNGVFVYDNCKLTYKDLGGLMIAKLNNMKLPKIECIHCHHFHSDNGKFATSPHRTHLCAYCGSLFRMEEKQVGNELSFIFNIPDIKLNDEIIDIKTKCNITYNLLTGELLVNNKNVNKINKNNKELSLVAFLNEKLKNEY